MTFEQHLRNVLDVRRSLDMLYPEKKMIKKDKLKDTKKK